MSFLAETRILSIFWCYVDTEVHSTIMFFIGHDCADSKGLLNAMVINDLPELYSNFVVQKSFNLAGISVVLSTRLNNFEEIKIARTGESG